MAEIDLADAERELFSDGIDARVFNGGTGKVSVEQCAEWRRQVPEHAGDTQIADDEGVSATTVRQHVRDECSHEVDELTPTDREKRDDGR